MEATDVEVTEVDMEVAPDVDMEVATEAATEVDMEAATEVDTAEGEVSARNSRNSAKKNSSISLSLLSSISS